MYLCGYHQGGAGAVARFECLQCKRYACDSCARRIGEHNPVWECPGCRGMLTALKDGAESRVAREAAPRVRQSVLARMPECLSYLKSRSVLLVLTGLAVVCTLLYWGAAHTMGIWVIVGFVLAFGLEASVYFQIVEHTAHGVLELEVPEFQNAWSDIVGPAFRCIAAGMPMVAAVLWFASQLGDVWTGVPIVLARPGLIFGSPGPALLLVVGILMWPMLTLAGAMSRSVAAMYDPRSWVRTLRVMGREYWAGVLAFYGVLAVDVFTVLPLRYWLMEHVQIPVVTGLLATFAGYFPMALRARLLGAAAEPFVD
jgi:hypothetical protein